MKVSEWLREYQLTGIVPDKEDSSMAFWCGYLMGINRVVQQNDLATDLDMAIRCAEFVESQK